MASASTSPSNIDLQQTPLHGLHVERGAKMVPFAGYDMPVQYPTGIIKEHLHTRSAAGLFDVSHMGQLSVRARSGNNADAARELEGLVPVDVIGLAPGRQRYALFTNPLGGILDDLMIANLGDRFFIVVNASCKEPDEQRLRAHLSATCTIESHNDHALLALQGPGAEAALARLAPGVAAMRFMDVKAMPILGAPCLVARSGYTGEDGFEISVPAAKAEAFARALLDDPTVSPIGLGARDSLRLEAGLCLYGSDLDPTITPVEAGLEWAIQKVRRSGGTRAGGFPGADVVLRQLGEGAERRRVGLKPDGRAPIRGNTPLFRNEQDGRSIGIVTSGTFGPSVNAPVAMGYVPIDAAKEGSLLFAEVRGKRLPVTVAALPFVNHAYKRS